MVFELYDHKQFLSNSVMLKNIFFLSWNIIQPEKRNKVQMHATTWMNLENVILSEGSQSQKTICCMFPFI